MVSNLDTYLVSWDKASKTNLEQYRKTLDYVMSNISCAALRCESVNCQNADHIEQLDRLYKFMVECLLDASDELPLYKRSDKFEKVVGWNQYCRQPYEDARRKFILWCEGGKLRSGKIFDEMKCSRSLFKNSLKYCRMNELKLRRERLLQLFDGCKTSLFWKELKKLKPKVSSSLTIDGSSDIDEILSSLENGYKGISVNAFATTNNVDIDFSEGIINESQYAATGKNLKDAVDNLNTSLGWDMIH